MTPLDQSFLYQLLQQKSSFFEYLYAMVLMVMIDYQQVHLLMMNIYFLYIVKYLRDAITIRFAKLRKDVRRAYKANDRLIRQVYIDRVSRISDGSEDLNSRLSYLFIVFYQYLDYVHLDHYQRCEYFHFGYHRYSPDYHAQLKYHCFR